MFFFLQQSTTKVLSFKPTAEPKFFVKNPLPKLSDAKKRACQWCGELNDKLLVWATAYIDDPQQPIDYYDDAKWENTEVCRPCWALLYPEDDF